MPQKTINAIGGRCQVFQSLENVSVNCHESQGEEMKNTNIIFQPFITFTIFLDDVYRSVASRNMI